MDGVTESPMLLTYHACESFHYPSSTLVIKILIYFEYPQLSCVNSLRPTPKTCVSLRHHGTVNGPADVGHTSNTLLSGINYIVMLDVAAVRLPV